MSKFLEELKNNKITVIIAMVTLALVCIAVIAVAGMVNTHSNNTFRQQHQRQDSSPTESEIRAKIYNEQVNEAIEQENAKRLKMAAELEKIIQRLERL